MSTSSSSSDKTTLLVSAIQDILLAEPTGLTSRDIAHRLVLKQAPYSTQSSGAFIKRVQRLLSVYNSGVRTNKGSCFRYNHDAGLWMINSSDMPSPKTPPKKLPSFQLSRNTTQTTTTMTPSQSESSLSVISSVVGSSLTTGIMEQVSTWRTGLDTDDDDEASLEIGSSYPSYPSQVSRDESYASGQSGRSLLNGIEMQPTLHLQFPQHPLDQPFQESDLYHPSSYSDIMPPPSSGYRRHSVSSHHQRPAFGRTGRNNQEDPAGDQFVPNNRSSYHGMTADLLARSMRQPEARFQGGMATSGEQRLSDQGSNHAPINRSGFPSPQTSTPSPRAQSVHTFAQPGFARGDQSETHRRHSSTHSAQLRLSPNQLEGSRSRAQNRRSMDDLAYDQDDPMQQREMSRSIHAPSPRVMKEDMRLRDLGASLQKSLSFNGDDDRSDILEEAESYPLPQRPMRPHSVRHHPYQVRQRMEPPRGQPVRPARPPLDNMFRDRKGKGRAAERAEDDRDLLSKTPVLLNAINTSQTNILSELQNIQRANQEEIAHFREEIYSSLQVAFTKLADQVEGVGRSVDNVENTQKDTVRQLGESIGSAMGDVFHRMTESLQQQMQQQYQIHQQQQQQQQSFQNFGFPSRPASIRQASPFPSGVSLPNSYSSSQGGFVQTGAGSGNRSNFVQGGRDSWKREQETYEHQDDDDDDEEAYGRFKRRAVERPRSTSGSSKTISKPRKEFED
ncbi:hypothetical protein BGZ88_008612 [Linnemannia elongata]|uniref:Uncharacterized protein n=1 Tax=Linnemannia elongata AG-77 TaxID=1314771 RepID=A0A197JPK8_9FUNG|nr:hypothetical protein BGZ88_008612 [Linnemannia elongata]KAG0069824.1 hypothetical protein BGZ89_002085 [Linnemannia elongata]OAQ27095.1 hypothetical protein K457DRAFT_157147 [Linnemannia elongata AG-77]